MNCAYLTLIDNSENILCSNSAVSKNGIVPAFFCRVCPHYSIVKSPLAEIKRTTPPCIDCSNKTDNSMATLYREPYTPRAVTLNPIPKPANHDWSVVVTTSPRRDPTIIECVNSIYAAGWEPVVFAEPDSILIPNVRWVSNPVRLGAWHNWLQSIKWALNKTSASYIMTVQDDSLFHPDSRSFVETLMWPTHTTGFISLYTASHYSVDKAGHVKPVGVNRLETCSLWGACALVWSRSVLEQIIHHPLTDEWTGLPPKNLTDAEQYNILQAKKASPHLIQNVDTFIGRVLNGMSLEMYVVDPSPVQHIARFSAINHGNNEGRRNCVRCADHSVRLAEQVFPLSNKPLKVGSPQEIIDAFESEIGYRIQCETCIQFVKSLEDKVIHDLKTLVIRLYANIPFPNEWRKLHISKTNRLQRIEDIIKPLLVEV